MLLFGGTGDLVTGKLLPALRNDRARRIRAA
jgi:glucose-6-phosphate 1-dehydrogenase